MKREAFKQLSGKKQGYNFRSYSCGTMKTAEQALDKLGSCIKCCSSEMHVPPTDRDAHPGISIWRMRKLWLHTIKHVWEGNKAQLGRELRQPGYRPSKLIPCYPHSTAPNSHGPGVCFHVYKMRAVNLLCLRELYLLIMKKFLLQTVAEPAWSSTLPHNLLKWKPKSKMCHSEVFQN